MFNLCDVGSECVLIFFQQRLLCYDQYKLFVWQIGDNNACLYACWDDCMYLNHISLSSLIHTYSCKSRCHHVSTIQFFALFFTHVRIAYGISLLSAHTKNVFVRLMVNIIQWFACDTCTSSQNKTRKKINK